MVGNDSVVAGALAGIDRGAGSRWVQLTYSSFDPGSGASGGWQIKQTSGEPTAAEQETLRSRIETRVASGSPVPSFPTQDEIDALPRRLVYRPLSDGTAGYWHTVSAGLDGSGRPGNVFAHTVLDRNIADSSPPIRPIDTWRSADWLTPFGPQQVLAAELTGTGLPAPGPVNRAGVLDFLYDPAHWRLGVLGPLLDAAAHAMAGGPPVVVVVGSIETGAYWIAAVCHLMSAGTSRACGFSTMETARAGDTDPARWPALTVVERADFSAGPEWGAVVQIDEDEIVDIGDLAGAAHVTRAGSTIEVTAWSAMAQEVVGDRAVTEQVLDAMDRIAVAIGDTDLWVSWPMALALTKFPTVLARVEAVAAGVIAGHSPAGLRDHPAEFRAAADLVTRTIGDGAAAAWRALQRCLQAGQRSVMVEMVCVIYLQRALQDWAWVLSLPEIPLPASDLMDTTRSEGLAVRARELLDQMRRDAGSCSTGAAQPIGREQVEDAVYALRVLDGIARLGLVCADQSPNRPREDDLYSVIEAVIIPVLFDFGCSSDFLARIGTSTAPASLTAAITTEVINRMESRDRELGQRLSSGVLTWLSPVAPPAPRIAALPPECPVLTAEIAIQIMLGDIKVGRPELIGWAPVALWCLLADSQQSRRWPSVTERLWAAVCAVDVWTVTDLDAIDRRFQGKLPLPVVGDALWTAELIPELGRLAQQYGREKVPPGLRQPGGEYTFADIWTLRTTAGQRWWALPGSQFGDEGIGHVVAASWSIAARARRFSVPGRSPALPVGTGGVLLAALVLLSLTNQQPQVGEVVVHLLHGVSRSAGPAELDYCIDVLDDCLERRLVTDRAVWRMALKGLPDLPPPWTATPAESEIGSIKDNHLDPVLEILIRRRLARKAIADPAAVLSAVNQQVKAELSVNTGAAQDAERLGSDWEKFAKAWSRRMRSDSSSGMFSGRALFRRG